MEDYPRDQLEFEARFATEEAYRESLAQLHWPDGFCCPQCGHGTGWSVRGGFWQRTECGQQTSVTAGTLFHRARQALRLWFRAMRWVTSQKQGASVLRLQRVLGLGSYRAGWMWLHKLRRVVVRPGRGQLGGRVETDETYVGGKEEGVHGWQTVPKVLVATAVEMRKDGSGLGRIRLRVVEDASVRSLLGFVREAVEPGSTVHTDGRSS